MSMPDHIFEVLRTTPVGWYECPNGHRYSVSHCTKPMEETTCPDCGAAIGGTDHIAVAGNRRLTEEELAQSVSTPGYTLETTSQELQRSPNMTTHFLRLIVHSCLLLASFLGPKQAAEVSALVCKPKTKSEGAEEEEEEEQKKEPAPEDAQQVLIERMVHDYKALGSLTEVSKLQLSLALALVMHSLLENHTFHHEIFHTIKERNYYEGVLEKALHSAMGVNLQRTVEHALSAFSTGEELASIRLALGEAVWSRILEDDVARDSTPPLNVLLWRYRRSVSFAHFERFCSMSGMLDDSPILKKVLQHEAQLADIRGIGHVLAWHNLLFTVFPPWALTRYDAMMKTHRDVIASVPTELQASALAVFHRFADTFNRVLPKYKELFFECQDNPFVEGDRVLSPLTLDSPVIWSLPALPVSHGAARPAEHLETLCTVRILQLLMNTHNEVVQAVGDAKRLLSEKRDRASYVTQALLMDRSTHAMMEDTVPTISASTPPLQMKRRLIIYKREKHLSPLLGIFARQSFRYGEGDQLGYQLDHIQAAFVRANLTGKTPINIYIRNYQFAGGNPTSRVHSPQQVKVKQTSLENFVLQQIKDELDTKEQASLLLPVVGFAIQLLSDQSSEYEYVAATTLLDTFLHTVHYPSGQWDIACTPTIRQQVQLCHLLDFSNCLEEITNGDPMDAVYPAYKQSLSNAQRDQLTAAAPALDLSMLLPLMRVFLLRNLSSSEYSQSPQDSLKQFLSLLANDEACLEDCDWFQEYFPDTLTLAEAYETFLLLSTHHST